IIQFRFGDDGVEPTHTDHGQAVNLDVLLLKAKALNVEEIRKLIKKKPSPKKNTSKKSTPKKPAPKKKSAPKKKAGPVKAPAKKPAKKPVKKTTPKSKPKDKDVDDESLQQQYEEETGKKSIWRGKKTKAFQEWKDNKSN
ncbi:hypothetical protein LCGC14_1527180, partial [marine sediment metagenome]